MHEYSFALELVRLLREIAERYGAGRITRARVRVGKLKQIVPSLLVPCVEVVAAEDPLLRGLVLEVEEEEIVYRCADCGLEFNASLGDLRAACPRCGSGSTELVAGDEVTLICVEAEEVEEDTGPQG